MSTMILGTSARAFGSVRDVARRAGSSVAAGGRPAVRLVRPAGWTVLTLTVGCLAIGRYAGWDELAVFAAAGVVVLALCSLFLLGAATVEVTLQLMPQRLSVGEPPVTGDLTVVNPTGRPLTPIELELPVGARAHRFRMPMLGGGATHTETFLVPSTRRGVIDVGPVRTRRGDPLGLFSRTVERTDVTQIFVRPRSLPLESLGAGLLRDLEGVTTQEISQSDLAFHALREYSPGDDLRHVHWLSSAKSDQLMVRQYLDTRRSHITVVVDDHASSYGSPDDFETALSVAASIARRSFVDEFQVTFVAGEHAVADGSATRVLDTMCRTEIGSSSVVDATLRASHLAPDTSLLFVVGGSGLHFRDARRASAAFGPEVSRYAIRIDPATKPTVSENDGLPVLSLARLEGLPALLRWAVR